jgi:hypothetical protein
MLATDSTYYYDFCYRVFQSFWNIVTLTFLLSLCCSISLLPMAMMQTRSKHKRQRCLPAPCFIDNMAKVLFRSSLLPFLTRKDHARFRQTSKLHSAMGSGLPALPRWRSFPVSNLDAFSKAFPQTQFVHLSKSVPRGLLISTYEAMEKLVEAIVCETGTNNGMLFYHMRGIRRMTLIGGRVNLSSSFNNKLLNHFDQLQRLDIVGRNGFHLSVDVFLQLPLLTHLQLNDGGLRQFDHTVTSTFCPGLTVLHIGDNPYSDYHILDGKFESLVALTWSEAYRNRSFVVSPTRMANLAGLRALDLSNAGNRHSQRNNSIVDFVGTLRNLEIFKAVDVCLIADWSPAIARLTRLQVLDIHFENIENDLNLFDPGCLANLPDLRYFDISRFYRDYVHTLNFRFHTPTKLEFVNLNGWFCHQDMMDTLRTVDHLGADMALPSGWDGHEHKSYHKFAEVAGVFHALEVPSSFKDPYFHPLTSEPLKQF